MLVISTPFAIALPSTAAVGFNGESAPVATEMVLIVLVPPLKDTHVSLDATTVLSRNIASLGIFPAIDPLESSSRILDPHVIGEEHYRTATDVKELLQRYRDLQDIIAILGMDELSDDDKLRRHTILNLMCNLELPWSLTEERWGASVKELMPEMMKALPELIDDGLCEMDETSLRITAKGRYFVRNVAMTMDAYLGKGKGKPIFSKTV